ncbi:hypothetical protein R6Q59_009989 [Mikania micrantha]
MTETSSLLRNNSFLKTFSTSNPYPVTTTTTTTTSNISTSPLPNGVIADSNVLDEEEYTIKCICIYTDDDGNTVYCPKCDTWQHIECYYHGKKVPDEHFCADCLPRDLDGRKATERQRRAREQLEGGGDRKVKRPSTKTSKKKHKDSISSEQANGWITSERHDSVSNGRDQPPPAKKSKTTHRTSGPVPPVNGESRASHKRSFSRLESYPSPSKSPQDHYRFPTIPQYTHEFLELYERDEGTTDCYDNEYTITASNFLSQWKTDRSLVVTHNDQQPSSKSPFVHTSEDLEKRTWPSTKLRSTTWETTIDGKHPSWRYLVLETGVHKDEIIGEITGEVGMLEEYCQQQSNQNRWLELAHPDPFVFFHPHMNIYIDSRRKGTLYRYLRRSCQPNVTLKTFVNDDGEMRHCAVANQDIKGGSELTAAWFINPAMFDMSAKGEDVEQLEIRRCEWVSRVLANFGDCACDKTQCPWARLDRRTTSRPSEGVVKSSAGRKRKGKSKQAISPLSTGQATNSRAGSEAVKGQDDDDQFDRRSTSESSRSGARSRDSTPVNVAVLDADPVLGNGLTARELRKIQAVEKAFERKEGATDKKKKKRTSGGSTLNTPNAGSSKQLGYSPGPTDGKSVLGSPPPSRLPKDINNKAPTTPRVQLPTRPVYISVGVQTDVDECDLPMPSLKRRKFSTPTQRLLKRVLHDRMLFEQQNTLSPSCMPKTSPMSVAVSTEVEMKDAVSAISPSADLSSSKSPTLSPTSVRGSSTSTFPAVTYPSQVAHTQTHLKPHPARLHLHTLPPVPTFSNGVTSPDSSTSTPALTTPSTAQSPSLPFAGSPSYQSLTASIVMPSPIKKKLSLGDYMSRRNMSATPLTEKSQAQADAGMGDSEPKYSNTNSEGQGEGSGLQSVIDEANNTGVEAEAVEDVIVKDEDELEYSPPGASPAVDNNFHENESTTDSNADTVPAEMNPNAANVIGQLAQSSDRAQSQSAG